MKRRDFIKAAAVAPMIGSPDVVHEEIELPKTRVNPMTGEVYVPYGADKQTVEIVYEEPWPGRTR